jgi:hypothetical protein
MSAHTHTADPALDLEHGDLDHGDLDHGGLDQRHLEQHDQRDDLEQRAIEETRSEGNTMVGMGLGLGAFGVASGALLGAVCPLCVVVAPALVGTGIYKRVCAKRMAHEANAKVTDEP